MRRGSVCDRSMHQCFLSLEYEGGGVSLVMIYLHRELRLAARVQGLGVQALSHPPHH